MKGVSGLTDGSGTASTASSSAATKSADAGLNTENVLRFAAAHILATMAESHRSIRRGLGGSTNWRSLGLHYIATTTPAYPEAKKQELLARALDLDHNNIAARLAFRHSIDRKSTDERTLKDYSDWLKRFSKELGEADFDTRGLKVRALNTRTAITLNAVYANAKPAVGVQAAEPPAGELDTLTAAACEALTALLSFRIDERPEDQGLARLLARAKEDACGMEFLIKQGAKPDPKTVTGMYNLACTFASRHDVSWKVPDRRQPDDEREAVGGKVSDRTQPDDDREAVSWKVSDRTQPDDDREAVRLLRIAAADPENESWMRDDPQLASFRMRTAYQNEFLAKARDDFFALATVKSHATRLKAAGYGQVQQVADATPGALTGLIFADSGIARHVVELARLDRSLFSYEVKSVADGNNEAPPPTHPLRDWRIEVLHELETRGLATRRALRDMDAADRSATCNKVAEAILTRAKPGAGRKAAEVLPELRDWLVAWSAPR